ncbi:MAG: radical SAM protein [Patescibacteria group bacterium]
MTQPKVLLIYPPNQLNPQEMPRPDGSLGPLYLAAALDKAGIENDVVDASVGTKEQTLEQTFYRVVQQENGLIRIGMNYEEMKELIAKGGYNVVGIHSNFTPQTKMALEVAKAAKEVSPDILVISGGVNARNLSDRFFASGCLDVICYSEGEEIIVKIVRAWEKKAPWETVSGIMFVKDGKIVKTPLAPGDTKMNLDELPIPAWHKLPLDKYAAINSPHGNFDDSFTNRRYVYAPIMTSRGCPFKCSYCHISKEREFLEDIGNLRLKSVERVLEEIKILKKLNVVKVYFEDDSLLAKKSRVKQIFTKLRGEDLHIVDVNGVNLVHFLVRNKKTGKLETDRDYMEILKASGFDHIVFPVESASQRILDKYATSKLHLETMDLIEMARIAVDVGITCSVNMMIGFPDETEEEMRNSAAYGKRMVDAGAKHCSFFCPIPFPGSQLYDYAIANGHLTPDFDPDFMNWFKPVMKNTVVSPERLLELKQYLWETVNPRNYVEKRLQRNIGNRWSTGALKKDPKEDKSEPAS